MLFKKERIENKRNVKNSQATHKQQRIIQFTSSHNGTKRAADSVAYMRTDAMNTHMWLCRVVVDRVITIQIATTKNNNNNNNR